MVTQGYSATYGARPLRRAVQRLIEDPVAEAVLDGYCAGGTLQLDADTSGNLLMRNARGQQRVVEMREGEKDLPTTYDPDALADYFGKRPGAVFSRVLQVASTSASYLTGLAWDAARGKLEEAEVARAAQLRRTIVSLGPFYIKLGQALSIRPDILSPQAMVQLQQLCDKVPPFDSAIAMARARAAVSRLATT